MLRIRNASRLARDFNDVKKKFADLSSIINNLIFNIFIYLDNIFNIYNI